MYDIVIDDSDKVNIINKFIENLTKTIVNVDENLRSDFIECKVDNLFKKIGKTNDNNNLLNYLFEIKKLGYTHSLNKVEKIKYYNNNCNTILITQYYNTEDKQRHKENTISLVNNILNPHITKIHLLNEELYDLEFIFKSLDNTNKQNNFRDKVKQHIIEKRMTFHDSMAFANQFCKNSIIIVANLDIFFNEDLTKLQSYDFSNLFLSLSRFELLNDYRFDNNNQVAKFIHNGELGNPCIDSHDAWIFKTPIKMTSDSKVMLGSLGCDTIINYIYGETMKYNVVNPIDSIMTVHYHRERERDYRTTNGIRSHSGMLYNKDNTYKSDDYSHKYILQKSILVCNTIESFCTFATKNAFNDLRLLLHSLEIYHKDIPIFIYCDSYISEKIDENNFDLQIYKKIELNKYKDLNRQSMEAQNIFTEFLLNKANVIDYAMETYNNTLFIDADIVILNKMDLLIDKSCDVGLSPHNIFEKSEKMYGVYNAGFMYVSNPKITDYWKHIIKIKNGYDDQQALDYFEDEFKVFKFDDSYNFGWWRLFQCNNPQDRANLFTIENNNLYYSYKTLKCIHTHLYDTNDLQTSEFNKFILQLLEKTNHPMLKFIKNPNIKNADNKTVDNKTIDNKTIDNTKNTDKIPTIIIPKMPRNDFWHHNNDTFRELIMLWNENNLINLVEDDVKHVWYNKIGDILLYDRPTLDWLKQDTNVTYNKILFGNPIVPDELKQKCKAINWIFWGRSPRKLNYFANMKINSYEERRIESIFIGKIENNVQAKYRLKYSNIEKVIQLYIMHKQDEPYRYNQEEYLNLLRNSKFGLCLRGFGPKCNREIELLGLGTVPIVAHDVDMCNYYDSLIENVHYFRFTNVDDIKEIISTCTVDKWNSMSNACILWYNKNCSLQGSFKTTKYIIDNFNKVIESQNSKQILCDTIKQKENDLLQSKKELEVIDNVIETYNMIDNLKCIDNINDKIVFEFGKEEEFIRENLKSYFNISKIYELHKKNHNDMLWDNVNKFIKVQNKYIARFDNVKINSDGVMYDNENVYTLNNNYDKNSITKKKAYTFDDNIVVFNCIQKNGNKYYNWLCEIYPRLFYIKLFIENNLHLFTDKKIVLLLYYNDDFIKEFLEILNFKNICICPYDANLEYQANITYLYTPTFFENPSKDAINIIRKSLFNNSVCVPRVNILIKKNNNRIIQNFDDVYNLLKTNYSNYEWIVFDSEDEIYKNSIKTIQLFSQANLIIGAHGAGLTNMIFSSPNAKIIELHPDNCGNVCYWHLSQIINNTHIMLLVKSISQLEFTVNLEQLDITVSNLLNNLFCIDNI